MKVVIKSLTEKKHREVWGELESWICTAECEGSGCEVNYEEMEEDELSSRLLKQLLVVELNM